MNGITPRLPVIIVGAGMTGLTLAQGLKKKKVPFEIYERDLAVETDKGHGWALTVHWALPSLEECLPPSVFERLNDIQVDPQQGIKDTGRFLFLDLATAQPKYVIPPNKRMRLNRKLLRRLLAEGIDVRYGKTLVSFDMRSDDLGAVEVTFSDGTKTRGCLLIGTDGRNSKTRRLLVGEEQGKLNYLPVRSMGTSIFMTPEQIAPLLQIDPLLFQGCHPDTGVYMWFSLVSSPAINGSNRTSTPYYEGQIIQSWAYKTEDDEVPKTDSERLARMKQNAQHFESRLRNATDSLPADSKVLDMKFADWLPGSWPHHNGRITLAGDSAHAMTSYRGEAFNHAVTDAATLSKHLASAWWSSDASNTIGTSLVNYESEMRARTHDAVLLSTQACLDAHDLHALRPDSPLVSRRAKVAQDAKQVRFDELEAKYQNLVTNHEALFALREQDVSQLIQVRILLAQERREHEATQKLLRAEAKTAQKLRTKLAQATSSSQVGNNRMSMQARPPSPPLSPGHVDPWQAAKTAALEQRLLELDAANADLRMQLNRVQTALLQSGSKRQQQQIQEEQFATKMDNTTAGISALFETALRNRERHTSRIERLRQENEELRKEVGRKEDEIDELEDIVERLKLTIAVGS